MTLQTLRRNPWPYAIIAWFVVFGTGMAAWVVVAVRNDPELVRADYYEQEITYQQQLDRLKRTAAVRNQIALTYDAAGEQVVLRLPSSPGAGSPSGTIHFYRPSNARLDFEVPVALDAAGLQRVPAGKLQGGLWKVRVNWTSDGEEFHHDQSLVL